MEIGSLVVEKDMIEELLNNTQQRTRARNMEINEALNFLKEVEAILMKCKKESEHILGALNNLETISFEMNSVGSVAYSSWGYPCTMITGSINKEGYVDIDKLQTYRTNKSYSVKRVNLSTFLNLIDNKKERSRLRKILGINNYGNINL